MGYVQVYIIQASVVPGMGFEHPWARPRDRGKLSRPLGGWVGPDCLPFRVQPSAPPMLPQPPRAWSVPVVAATTSFLIVWGLYCAGVVIRAGFQGTETVSQEEALLRSFPFVMMVAAILLIVTGRSLASAKPLFFPVGLLVAAFYVAIWMFNGKRSHSLLGVLATVSPCYITRLKRPSWPVLFATSFSAASCGGDRDQLAKQQRL